jgi:hypothetical protein
MDVEIFLTSHHLKVVTGAVFCYWLGKTSRLAVLAERHLCNKADSGHLSFATLATHIERHPYHLAYSLLAIGLGQAGRHRCP